MSISLKFYGQGFYRTFIVSKRIIDGNFSLLTSSYHSGQFFAFLVGLTYFLCQVRELFNNLHGINIPIFVLINCPLKHFGKRSSLNQISLGPYLGLAAQQFFRNL